MKYIVFEYIGKGWLYLVPERDEKELEVAEEMARQRPDRLKKAGEIELDMWYGPSWWNKGRAENEKPVTRVSSRNADYL